MRSVFSLEGSTTHCFPSRKSVRSSASEGLLTRIFKAADASPELPQRGRYLTVVDKQSDVNSAGCAGCRFPDLGQGGSDSPRRG
jgi:hypothetical protein